LRIGKHDIRARSSGACRWIGPAIARGDEAEAGEPEIEHRARGLADVFAELGADENDYGA
jgi:hypothetical protein